MPKETKKKESFAKAILKSRTSTRKRQRRKRKKKSTVKKNY